MKNFIKDNLWFKFLYQFCMKSGLKFLNFFKFWLYLKGFIFIFIFKFINQFILYKILFNKFIYYKIKNDSILKKNKIQKGLKSKKLGIYLRDFLKKKDNVNNNSNKQNVCYFLMRFKRKNLFLTLLNNDGNVLCKTNIGSCGFKKKVKFTGYAIKRTSKSFYEKIAKSLVKTMYFLYKTSEKKKDRIKELVLLKKNVVNDKFIFFNKLKRSKIKKYNSKKNKIKTLLSSKIINNKKVIRTSLLSKKVFKSFLDYRNYPHFVKILKNSLRVVLRIKSNLKFWGFRFIMYGLIKRFYWFHGIEIRLPIPHSKGLRLRKKRRI